MRGGNGGKRGGMNIQAIGSFVRNGGGQGACVGGGRGGGGRGGLAHVWLLRREISKEVAVNGELAVARRGLRLRREVRPGREAGRVGVRVWRQMARLQRLRWGRARLQRLVQVRGCASGVHRLPVVRAHLAWRRGWRAAGEAKVQLMQQLPSQRIRHRRRHTCRPSKRNRRWWFGRGSLRGREAAGEGRLAGGGQ